jgi:hypothetical protein
MSGVVQKSGSPQDSWELVGLINRENEAAGRRSLTASSPLSMPLDQKVVLTVLFACTAGRDRPIKETITELAVLSGMHVADYFATLLQLKHSHLVSDDTNGLRINRHSIQNARAIDAYAASATKSVRNRGDTLAVGRQQSAVKGSATLYCQRRLRRARRDFRVARLIDQ